MPTINPFAEDVKDYCEHYTQAESDTLIRLKEDSRQSCHGAVMISDKMTARLLQLRVKMMNARTILDVGTYTGYSALAMAEAIAGEGVVYTIDRSVQPSTAMAKKHFALSEVADKLRLVLGRA